MACGCSAKGGCKSAVVLSKLLANSYALLLKTQNVHWNVVFFDFRAVHLMTEEHYDNLFDAIDVIAERIRMIGSVPPATFEEFSKIATVKDALSAKTGKEMLTELLASHEIIRDEIKAGLSEISGNNDYGTEGVLTDRLAFHEKAIWIIKSTLELA